MSTPLRQIIPNASTEGVQLIKDMLLWNPQKRPSAAQSLRYPYFMVGVDLPQARVAAAQRSSAKNRDNDQGTIRRVSNSGKSVKPLTKKPSGIFDDYDFDDPKENQTLQHSMNNGNARKVSDNAKPVKPVAKKSSAFLDDFDAAPRESQHLGHTTEAKMPGAMKVLEKRSVVEHGLHRERPVKNVESDSLLDYGSNLDRSGRGGVGKRGAGAKVAEGEATKELSKNSKLPFLGYEHGQEKSMKHGKENPSHRPDHGANSKEAKTTERNTSIFGAERKKWAGPKRTMQDDDLEALMNEIEGSANNKGGTKVTLLSKCLIIIFIL